MVSNLKNFLIKINKYVKNINIENKNIYDIDELSEEELSDKE